MTTTITIRRGFNTAKPAVNTILTVFSHGCIYYSASLLRAAIHAKISTYSVSNYIAPPV